MFRKDALRRAHDAITRLIAEAAEPEVKRHIVWGNTHKELEDEESRMKDNYRDFNVGSFYEIDEDGEPVFDEDALRREARIELNDFRFDYEMDVMKEMEDDYDAFVVADLHGAGRNGSRRCEVFRTMEDVFNFAHKTDFSVIYVEGDRLMIERHDHDGTGTYVVYGVTEADRVDIEDKAYRAGRNGDGSFDYAGFDDLVYCAFTENDPKARKIFDGIAKPLGGEVKEIYGWS